MRGLGEGFSMIASCWDEESEEDWMIPSPPQGERVRVRGFF